MKKFVLVFLAALGFIQLNTAQHAMPLPKEKLIPAPLTAKQTAKFNNSNKIINRGPADISQWYRYTRAFEQGVVFGNLDYGVSWLAWDSNSYQVLSDNSKENIFTHLIGSTIDCKDSLWGDANNAIVTRFNPLIIDSLAIPRFYIRNLDSTKINGTMVEVVDTMIIQCFLASAMDFGQLVGVDPVLYAFPRMATMNQTRMLNSAAIKTIKIPLRKEDANEVNLNGAQTTFGSTIQEIPIGITTGSTSGTAIANNLFCWTLVYKPMVPVPLGDTVLMINGGAPFRKYNTFGYRQGRKDGFNQSRTNFTPNRMNSSIYTFTNIRYGQTQNGWNKYITSPAFPTSFFVDHFVKVSTNNLSTGKKNQLIPVAVYPNPSQKGTETYLEFSLPSSGNAQISIVDLNGKTCGDVQSIAAKAGKNSISLATNKLAKGVYFVTIQTTEGKSSAKLSIQ